MGFLKARYDLSRSKIDIRTSEDKDRPLRMIRYEDILLGKNATQVVSRVFAAVVLGYVLANVSALILAYMLPTAGPNAVTIGVTVSFSIFACAVLWVFSARSVWAAWLGLGVPIVIGIVAIRFVSQGQII